MLVVILFLELGHNTDSLSSLGTYQESRTLFIFPVLFFFILNFYNVCICLKQNYLFISILNANEKDTMDFFLWVFKWWFRVKWSH